MTSRNKELLKLGFNIVNLTIYIVLIYLLIKL
ncbi:hypothetical protein ACUXJN_001457 [Staphylococcus capitis]|nr:hypothetical protein AYP1020_0652 [Staphylococcus capitis subsp. capitis]